MSCYWFIACDYTLPLIDNRKVKFYKFKEGVKIDLDNEGKWYHYTNESDKNSSELLIPCSNKEASMMVVDSEEDLRELYIFEGYRNEYVEWYTLKENIYGFNFWYTDKRGTELINYLKDNIKKGHEIELWSTWEGERNPPSKYYYEIETITSLDIKKVFGSCGFNGPECIIISKKNSFREHTE